MKSWFTPLDPVDFTHKDVVRQWLCPNWFPNDAELVVTKHGSIEKEVIIKVVIHINQHATKTVPANGHILPLLDGHSECRSSRKVCGQ